LVRSLDPATLRAHDDARAHHSFGCTQFMTLSSQLDGLWSQISTLQQETNNLKRERDRAEMERTWAARFDKVAAHRQSHDRCGRSCSPSYPRHHGRGRGHTTFAERNGLQRVGGKVRTGIKYPEGGGMTVWETDASSDTTDFNYQAKKKQCRHQSPTSYQHHTLNHRCTPSPSPPWHLTTVNYCRNQLRALHVVVPSAIAAYLCWVHPAFPLPLTLLPQPPSSPAML
jgi:hypothetical protein